MENYKNFQVAIYCPAPFLRGATFREMEEGLNFFKKHLRISKVYLETHRGSVDVEKEKIFKVKEFFEKEGVKTSGGITTTISLENDEFRDLRIFNTFCYTNPEHLKKLVEIVEFTASIFDEIILDDFYFTPCRCPSCIEEKGDLSWEEFRLNLMASVSEEYVVKPAKRVNPEVKMIIKYPNWIESYQETGYNPEAQAEIFDYVYTGTETRDPLFTHQHLPRYLSYSLMRFFDEVKPGKNLGGWFDSFDCIYNIGYYLEQAYLTLFSKTKEITLFDFSSLRNSVFIPPLGHQLNLLDSILGELGNPSGIPVYYPFNSYGEDHLHDYLGMVGIPLYPTPYFPEDSDLIFITANSAMDKDILNKLKRYLLAGKNIVMTSGFLKAMQGKGGEEFTSLRVTDKKVISNFFGVKIQGLDFSQYVHGPKKVVFPLLDYRNNATWPEIVCIDGENNFPILMNDSYGRGKVFTLTVPDNFSDVYHFPREVLTEIRKVFARGNPFYIECEGKMGLFTYDNDTFIIESFLPYRTPVNIYIKGKDKKLIDMEEGFEYKPTFSSEKESLYKVGLEPSTFRVFKMVSDDRRA